MTSVSPRQGPIRVGVVGLSAGGGWAATAHVPALAGLDGYELRALSASSAESARAAGEKYAVPLAFGSAEELARSEEVDLVVVTVKVPHHLELIRPALEAREAARTGRKVTLAEQGSVAARRPRAPVRGVR